MPKTDNIFFKADPALVDDLKKHYGSANFAAARITAALPYLRASALQELENRFTYAEMIFLVATQKGTNFDPMIAANTDMMKTAVTRYHKMHKEDKDVFRVNIDEVLKAMDELSDLQCYFLFDFCSMYYRQDGADLEKYVSMIAYI